MSPRAWATLAAINGQRIGYRYAVSLDADGWRVVGGHRELIAGGTDLDAALDALEARLDKDREVGTSYYVVTASRPDDARDSVGQDLGTMTGAAAVGAIGRRFRGVTS